MSLTEKLSSAIANPRKGFSYLKRFSDSTKGRVLGNKICAFWYSDIVNFGDLITPALFKSYNFTPVLVPPFQAQVFCAGSILQFAPEHYSGHILGSGLIEDVTRRFDNAKIWAVRGKLTRERIRASTEVVLGDPGLLASRLLTKRKNRRYALGTVPHYVDKNDPRIEKIIVTTQVLKTADRPDNDESIIVGQTRAVKCLLKSFPRLHSMLLLG